MFQAHPDCIRCPLYKDCRNPGIKSAKLWSNTTQSESAATAVLVVGEKPGWLEDYKNEVWIGDVGDILRKVYIRYLASKVKVPTVIYGTNAVRCMPPQSDSPTAGQINACNIYLQDDLRELLTKHENVIVLAAGAAGSRAMGFSSLSKATKAQGTILLVEGIGHVYFFATHNPGILLPGRDPSAVDPTQDHLDLLAEFINTGKITCTGTIAVDHGSISRLPDNAGDIVALDIETYGCVDGLPVQTVFHPERAVLVDNCPPSQLIQTAAAAWRTETGIECAYWVFPEQQEQFWAFLRNLIRRGKHLLGQNLPFDVLHIRYVERLRLGQPWLTQPVLRKYGCKLLELGMANYHDCDVRNEKSLKPLSLLLRSADYTEDVNLSKGERYPSKWSPQLREYNCKDVMATLLNWERFKVRILRKYKNTDRMSNGSLAWYDKMIWMVIHMDEAGVTFDREKLFAVHKKKMQLQDRLQAWAKRRWDWPICGKGSKSAKEQLFLDGVQAASLEGDSRLEMTKKTRIVSTSKANRNLIVDSLPLGNTVRGQLRMLGAYSGAQKLTSSYTGPLLFEPARGCVRGRAYPSWYVAPGAINDDQGAEGGTKQCRLTAKNPAIQTQGPIVKKCQTSRFRNGVVLDCDSSQIERRMMALWSGDPQMMREYLEGQDCHLNAGIVFLREAYNIMSRRGVDNAFGFSYDWADMILQKYDAGALTQHEPRIKPIRQLGKVANFLMGFRGGAATLQGAARSMCRIELPLDFCKDVIKQNMKLYHGLHEWQDELIEEACRRGYLELPLCGDARLFRGSRQTVRSSYVTHICNFKIQGSAACVIKSAQAEIGEEIIGREMQSVITWNGYDAVYPDCPPEEEQEVQLLLDAQMDNPPYYQMLQAYIGRTLPLAHETKVLARRND